MMWQPFLYQLLVSVLISKFQTFFLYFESGFFLVGKNYSDMTIYIVSNEGNLFIYLYFKFFYDSSHNYLAIISVSIRDKLQSS